MRICLCVFVCVVLSVKHVAEEIDQLDVFLLLNQFDLNFAQSKLHEGFNSENLFI